STPDTNRGSDKGDGRGTALVAPECRFVGQGGWALADHRSATVRGRGRNVGHRRGRARPSRNGDSVADSRRVDEQARWLALAGWQRIGRVEDALRTAHEEGVIGVGIARAHYADPPLCGGGRCGMDRQRDALLLAPALQLLSRALLDLSAAAPGEELLVDL